MCATLLNGWHIEQATGLMECRGAPPCLLHDLRLEVEQLVRRGAPESQRHARHHPALLRRLRGLLAGGLPVVCGGVSFPGCTEAADAPPPFPRAVRMSCGVSTGVMWAEATIVFDT